MSVKSALRTLQILEVFAGAGRPMSLGEVARGIDAPRSSCLALLTTLSERGYVYRVGEPAGWYPTRRWADLSRAVSEHDPVALHVHAAPTGQAVEVIPSAKMSKSKKNVVDPADIIRAFGADTARWFILSDSPPERDVEWTAAGAEAAFKHLTRVWNLSERIASLTEGKPGTGDDDLIRATHRAIHDVTQAIEGFAFNKAIAKLYELSNTIQKSDASKGVQRQAVMVLAQLMSPMTPHLAEDVWARQGGAGLVTKAPWPKADPAMLVDTNVTLPIQINGKRRAEISVPKDMAAAEVEKIVLANEDVVKFLGGQPVKKLIVVPGRIVNVVM